jgi:hypothetical protein
LLLILAGTVLAAACSSSSGGPPPAAGSSSASASPGAVDRSTVDRALAQVVTGLRAATSISSSDSISTAARSLHTAAAALRSAGDALNPTPAGVPVAQSLPLSTGLLRISYLLGQASSCLVAQSHAKQPSTTRCLPPLRQAEQRDASVAHALISLAVYGSKSPRVIESELVAALHGK